MNFIKLWCTALQRISVWSNAQTLMFYSICSLTPVCADFRSRRTEVRQKQVQVRTPKIRWRWRAPLQSAPFIFTAVCTCRFKTLNVFKVLIFCSLSNIQFESTALETQKFRFTCYIEIYLKVRVERVSLSHTDICYKSCFPWSSVISSWEMLWSKPVSWSTASDYYAFYSKSAF